MKTLYLLLLIPLAAVAQNYDYTGNPMTGTETIWDNGADSTVAVTETLTASIAPGSPPPSYSVIGAGSVPFVISSAADGLAAIYGNDENLAWNSGYSPGFYESVSIEPVGDTLVIEQGSGNAEAGNLTTYDFVNYQPGSWIDPPTSVPEIDANDAAAGLTLLGGLALLVRGRRA
jgi:hypothetical protein